MGYNTKIDWCDATWNPVTGCLHGCEYCYARGIANRFRNSALRLENLLCAKNPPQDCGNCKECNNVLDEPMRCSNTYGYVQTAGISAGKIVPYPFGFMPTFYRYKLEEPTHWKKPRTIFVCSMSDLFGAWVPDEWIAEVFKACEDVPQHRYLFLTKNPGRYCKLERAGLMPHSENFWFGATFDHSNWPGADGAHKIPGRPTTFSIQGKMVHDAGDYYFPHYPEKNRFVSFEPLLYDIGVHIGSTGGNWHIIGAETGNRKGKVECKREWVEHIVEYSDKHHIPVFMKESLRELMGKDFRQEFPWEVK